MTKPTADTTVRDLVVEHPAARPVLERFGIDYCCGGAKPLGDAAREAGVRLEVVLTAVAEAIASAAHERHGEPDWGQLSASDLVHHVERRHHTYMKRALPRLDDLLAKVHRAHADAHETLLTALWGTFRGLRDEIELHLAKEEQVLFPLVRQLDACASGEGGPVAFHCGTVENPIQQMQVEHENAGSALARMRELTDDYALPPDACPAFEALYADLLELEQDLHEHIHLENNVLFPKAVEAEKACATALA